MKKKPLKAVTIETIFEMPIIIVTTRKKPYFSRNFGEYQMPDYKAQTPQLIEADQRYN